MPYASEVAGAELGERIRTLEESALYIRDLANCIPEHSDWLWRIENQITSEVQRLRESQPDYAPASA